MNVGADILSGLALFTLANAVTFFSASQLYSDPFVLIMLGLSSGAILAIPRMVIEYHGTFTNSKLNNY